MKKLIVLVTILSLSLTAFSQQDTTTKVKCLPVPVFKQIAQDLLRGDSCRAQLELANFEISKLNEKVTLKDGVIGDMKVKEENYVKIIEAENKKFEILEQHTKKIEGQLRREKFKNKFTKLIGGAIIAGLTFLTLTK